MSSLELLNKIAEGSVAEAFLARNANETVLVELSRPGLSDDVELYGRFLDATRDRQRLDHPYLLRRQGSGCRQDGRLFAVTESLSGLHLGLLGQIEPARAVNFLVPLTEALGYLHSRGVIHGHLRPSHVFLAGPADSPMPKLLDMGLLLFRSTRSLRFHGDRVLVPAEYLCPERISGRRATERSDVYGLGVLAFEILSGHAPFKGMNDEQTRRLHMTAPTPNLPKGAAWLQSWVHRCMRKDPLHRFATMADARDALLEANLARPSPAFSSETVSMRATEAPPPVVQGSLQAEAPRLGAYVLERVLGQGGMGQVWLAEHSTLQRKVAIKLLRPELVRVESQVQRFMDEARAVNRINHPHIVEITDLVEEHELGRVWCVMEYLQGYTLKDFGRAHTMSIQTSVNVVRQVCEALQAAHDVGVVHRDVKPDNIFLTETSKSQLFVKVLDFGVAKLREERAAGTTATGEIVGTPAYMSPEQALAQSVGAASDMYSLGTVLYVLLTGRFPFEGVTAPQVIAQIVARPPIPLPKISRSGEPIPVELEQVVMRCLAKEPAHRFSSMRALSEALKPFENTAAAPATERSVALDAFATHTPTQVAPAYQPRRPRGFKARFKRAALTFKRHRLIVLGTFGGIFALLTLGFLLGRGGQPSPEVVPTIHAPTITIEELPPVVLPSIPGPAFQEAEEDTVSPSPAAKPSQSKKPAKKQRR